MRLSEERGEEELRRHFGVPREVRGKEVLGTAGSVVVELHRQDRSTCRSHISDAVEGQGVEPLPPVRSAITTSTTRSSRAVNRLAVLESVTRRAVLSS